MPDPGYKDEFTIQNFHIDMENIIETKSGQGNKDMPDWLIEFFNAGIEEVEKMEYYNDRYCFIGRTENANFNALVKWSENFSVIYDFPKLAAARIENRIISASVLYPDDEYGKFYELTVKKAFSTEFPDTKMEDSFWVKKNPGPGNNENDYVYEFFILLSIGKTAMQTVMSNIMEEALAEANPTRAQNNSIRRLQQNFFEGF